MKKFLVNLLICFSLTLCGFLIFQWYREAKLRAEILTLQTEISQKASAMHELAGTLKVIKNEAARLDQLKTELTENVRANRLEIGQLKLDWKKEAGSAERLAQQVEAYKKALEQANENIKTQNENARKIVADAEKLAGERNDALAKHHQLISQYNELVRQFNQLQEQLAAAPKPPAPQ